jgi:redox-sensitive bicupin YhaK (pirin superfamily)
LYPHSGIATLTYIAEGAVSYIDPDNVKGVLPAGGVEWMQAGRGMWHGGGIDQAGRTRGFQLWIALPPELELGPTVSIYVSIYQPSEDIETHGPARVLLGSDGTASGAIDCAHAHYTFNSCLQPNRGLTRRGQAPDLVAASIRRNKS